MMDILIGQLFKGIKPAVLTWYRDRTGIAQKMHRLEMLVTKVRSVTEVYKKVEIKNDHLNKLQDMFDKAATKGEQVLCKLRDVVDSSSSSSGVSNFFERIFSRDENVNELNRTIEQMEDVSANVKDFLKTLKLELSKPVRQRKIRDIFPRGRPHAFRRTRVKSSEEEHTFLPAKIARLSPIRSVSVKSHEKISNNLGADISQADAVNSEEQELPTPMSDADNSEEQETPTPISDLLIKTDSWASSSLVIEELQPSSLPKLLTSEQIDQVAAADRMVAELQDAVDKAEQQGGDDSWFSRWITKLREAIEEGTCVVSAIKSNNYCVNDQIFDEVGVILTAACQKLESMCNELDDFSDLEKAEKLAREYTALRDAHSNKNSSLTLSL